MTITTLRYRFGTEQKNSATISQIIKEALVEGLIKTYDFLNLIGYISIPSNSIFLDSIKSCCDI